MSPAPLATAFHPARRQGPPHGADDRSDGQLLHDFAARDDQSAFADIVRRHGRLVLGVCRRVLRHQQDAEDAFQAAFLVLARRAATVRKGESLASWLYGVSYRVALRAKRDAARRRKREGGAEPPRPVPPGWEVAWREVQAVLDEEVGRLPPIYRGPFVLCCLDGLSKPAAAARLGLKEGTLSSRLARARKDLQQRLARRGINLSAVLGALALGGTAGAAVPKGLADATLRFATGDVGEVSARALTLAKGVMRVMNATKVKLATVLLLALGLLGAGVNVLARAAAPGAEDVEVAGRVVDPDGKPVAGARLHVWAGAPGGKPRATTGPDGRFRVTVTAAEAKGGATLVARADGLGPDWVKLERPAKVDVTLRLAKDDLPVRGRVLDLEGRPVAGATVRVFDVRAMADGGELGPWLKEQKEAGLRLLPPPIPPAAAPKKAAAVKSTAGEALGLPSSLSTGKDGRFRFDGVGRERAVFIEVRGPGLETTTVIAVTRPGPQQGLPAHFRGAAFDWAVGPSKPLVGTVRDRKTGVPLAKMQVYGDTGYTATDDQGRFRIDGVGKRQEYRVTAGGKPYFGVTKMVADTQGVEPLVVDIELDRGLVVRGRLTDGATGKPVRGHAAYVADVNNPALKERAAEQRGFYAPGDGGRLPEGTFEVLTLPGAGLVCITAAARDRYPMAHIEGWDGFLIRGLPDGYHPSSFHAVVRINPTPEDPKSRACDVVLEPGRTVAGRVEGPDGKPLAGALVAGLRPLATYGGGLPGTGFGEKMPSADFTALGLSRRKGRTLVFFHPEKKLGKVFRLPAGEEGPVAVRLEPLGAVTGRVLGADGRPWAGLAARAELTRLIVAYKDLPWEMLYNLGPLMKVTQTTEKDGRFRLDGLLPGLKYNLFVLDGEPRPGTPPVHHVETLPVESGKTKDLGDLKSALKRDGD